MSVRHATNGLCSLGIAVILAALFAGSGHGQQTHDSAMLTVHAGQSRMVRLDDAADSVFIAEPGIVNVQVASSHVLFLLGKAVGRTSLAVLDAGGEVVGRWTVNVALDLGPVRAALSEDTELGDVGVRPRRQGVELHGAVASAAAVERALELARASLPEKTLLINSLSVSSPQQVNLEVQIAEVQRSVTESLGINWEAVNHAAKGTVGFRVGRIASWEFPGAAFPPGAPSPQGQASSLFGSYSSPTGFGVRGLIDALAYAGLATVLARPNITAVSGETASFFSGGEFPLPSGFDDGQISFDYKKYGVLLDFVPTVIDSKRISLTVRPEVSERATTDSLRILEGVEIPVINVRRAETTIEVGNGESIVIAGLYRKQTDSTEAGVPALKDAPVLGRLFSTRATRANATELIVAVTARLIGARQDPSAEPTKQTATRRIQGYHY